MPVVRVESVPVEAEALQFAEDGSNWREFDGWCGWDILEDCKWWADPDPETVPSLEIIINGVHDDLMPGDWMIRRSDGDMSICPDGLFQKMYWQP